MTIKAIETFYNGYHFRSRLEARYAVMFDALGLEWEYEPEGFDLGELGRYLPDFFLPKLNVWIEIKGGKATDIELNKCSALFAGITGDENIIDLFMLGDEKISRDLVGKIIAMTKELGLTGKYSLKDSLNEVMDLNASRVHVFLFEGLLDDAYMCCKYAYQANPLRVMYHLLGHRLRNVDDNADRVVILTNAIIAARSARFEHGQKGASL